MTLWTLYPAEVMMTLALVPIILGYNHFNGAEPLQADKGERSASGLGAREKRT